MLTNASVTYNADRVWLEHAGIPYSVTVVGHDLITNLTVLKVDKRPPDMSFINLTDANEAPAVGTLALGITRELGMPPGPTFGMITGENISYGNRILPAVYLRTDIASDGGEGGSPVFDLNGRFLGIMIAALPEINGSFILPAKAVRRVRDDIIFSGEVSYAWFGIQASQRADLEHGIKVIVDEVVPNSPASDTEIQPGDQIVQIGEFPINSDYDLRNASFFTPAEKHVGITIKRADKELQFSLKTGIRPIAPPSEDVSLPGQPGIMPDSLPAPENTSEPVPAPETPTTTTEPTP